MKRIIVYCLSLGFVLSCQEDAGIELTKINGFPEDIIGCSCYFAESEADFKAQKYLYIDSYERNPAFISINDSLIQVSAEEQSIGDYEVILQIEKEVQLGSELYHREGSLTVVHKSGAVITKPVYGECGC